MCATTGGECSSSNGCSDVEKQPASISSSKRSARRSRKSAATSINNNNNSGDEKDSMKSFNDNLNDSQSDEMKCKESSYYAALNSPYIPTLPNTTTTETLPTSSYAAETPFSYENYYSRKSFHLNDSPHSSLDDNSSSNVYPSFAPTSTFHQTGDFAAIAAHSVTKENNYFASSDNYRLDTSAAPPVAAFNSKDVSLTSKYNQESYRIYSHQLHHHHHYHYPLSTQPVGSVFPYPDEVDAYNSEMDQYLENGKFASAVRKHSLKAEQQQNSSLTELAPMSNHTHESALKLNENSYHSVNAGIYPMQHETGGHGPTSAVLPCLGNWNHNV